MSNEADDGGAITEGPSVAPLPVRGASERLARATIEDVARRASVSVATVSRALRQLPNVAVATRQRVQQAAQDLAYRADPHASRLAMGRTRTIGMAVPLLGAWYFSQVVAGAEAVLKHEGYDLLLMGVVNSDERRRFVREWVVLQKRVDGLLLVDLRLDPEELAELSDVDAALVTIGDRYRGYSSVTIDNHAAAALAVRHLLDLGHRAVGLIGDSANPELSFSVPGDRRRGYLDAMAGAGIEPRAELEVPGNFTVIGGYAAMARLLATADPPTAVFAMSDEMAIGATKAARDHGLSVPDDLSIIGFDDHDLADAFGLTTIRQPVADIGGQAARFLIERLETRASAGPRVPAVSIEPTTLVVRSSTRQLPG